MSARARLRAIEARDLPGIVRIERAAFGDPWSEASFRSMLAQPQVLSAVLEREGAVCGYYIAWMVADEAELANLAVAPGERRRGHGAALLDHLLSEVAARGGATIHLEVRAGNAAAIALYTSRGFTESGRRKAYYQSPEEDALIMRRARAAGGPRAERGRPGRE